MPDLESMINIRSLVKELHHASDLLDTSINRYSEACATILNRFEPIAGGNAAQDLLDSVLAEFSRAFEYESKLQQAMAFMYRVRNRSPSFVPISLLPPEIMSRIFWFSNRCCLPKSQITRRNTQPESDLVYPEVASEVCYDWRQITIISHGLWSHIDIDFTSGPAGKLFSRALAFAARSSQALIDLHIRIDFFCRDDPRLADFCHSVSSRTRSLDLQCDGRASLPPNALSLLASLFSSENLGVMSRLYINAQPMREPGFLVSGDLVPSDRNPRILQILPLSEPLFEDIMSSILTMQLDGMYPYWSSRAYVGLVELDLRSSNDYDIGISEHELASVLRASPGLRAFCFDLRIAFESSSSPSIPNSVHLIHLETIQLSARCMVSQEAVLRMIRPGPLSLRMATEVVDHFSSMSPYWTEFANFISRSKITQLQIQGAASFRVFLELSEVSPSLTHLQELKLYGIILGQGCEEALGEYDAASFCSLLHGYNEGIPRQNLWFVQLVECRIYWNDFRHMFGLHPTQILKLDRCELVTTPVKHRHTYIGFRWEISRVLGDALNRICPVVELKNTFGQFEERNKFKLGFAGPDDDTYNPRSFGF